MPPTSGSLLDPLDGKPGWELQVSADRSSIAAGYIAGDVIQVLPGPRVRSAYLEQVRRIAPHGGLVGREAELSEMAEFCASETGSSYAWWRAGAWAGKSALMTSFVLDPPPGVEVVSFFVTARFAGQADWSAFAEVVLEQLADLLGAGLPLLPDATRGAHLLAMLGDAALACQGRGSRLVLVVDGLDEDAGVTPGHDSYSIAALLPVEPLSGMRVIVAGRPDPPIPADVPDAHPLRDPSIVRYLAPSSQAQMVRKDAERGLARLLTGTSFEQDLLGLVTAAGGGLSSADLARLTGAAEYDVRRHLHAVAGRTFASRISPWQPGMAPDVYVLAHEELQIAATHDLGEDRLAGCRDRLRSWADSYAAAGWPTGTPEYLLRGYFQMLQASGDTAGMIGCALDRVRHDRMLDIIGGDAAALAEITATQAMVLAQPEPDLTAVARLALHRDQLAERNAHIPAGLPTVWVRLGRSARAEALARSIGDPADRARALSGVAAGLASAGQLDRAAEIAGLAADAARSVTDLAVLKEVAAGLASAGQLDRAAEIAEQAVAAAMAITDSGDQAWVLSEVAGALAAAGQYDQAAEKAAQAEAAARSVVRPEDRARVFSELAAALAAAGQLDRAAEVAEQGAVAARSVVPPDAQARVLKQLAGTLAAAGRPDQAVAIARLVADSGWQARALSDVAAILESAAHSAEAAKAGDEAVAVARSITHPREQARVLSQVAGELAAVGRRDQAADAAMWAVAAARSTAYPWDQPWRGPALRDAAVALAATGEHQQAVAVAESITDSDWRVRALSDVAMTLAATGEHDLADAVAMVVSHSGEQAWTPSGGSAPQLVDGDRSRATAVALPVGHAGDRARALSRAVAALAAAGEHDQATEAAAQAAAAALSVGHAGDRARALSRAVAALAAAGEHDEATRTAAQAVAAARSVIRSDRRMRALSAVALALAAAGQHDHAETAARSIADPERQAWVLSHLANALYAAGELTTARRVLALAWTIDRWTSQLPAAVFLTPSTLAALADDLY